MLFIFLSFNQKIIIITLKHTNRTNIKSGKNQKKKQEENSLCFTYIQVYDKIQMMIQMKTICSWEKNSEQLNLTRFSYSDFNCDSYSCTHKYYKQKKRKTITIKIGDISSFQK